MKTSRPSQRWELAETVVARRGISVALACRTFGLCFLYLRNVRGHGWNHKRVYRVYRDLELNLRITPPSRGLGLKRSPPARWRGHRPFHGGGRN